MKKKNDGKISQKALDRWVKWSMHHLENGRVDAFLQGWTCAYALFMSVQGMPEAVRKEISRVNGYAEGALWKKTRKLKY